MFSAVAKTLGQLSDPPIRRVIGKVLGLAILGYVLFVVLVYLLIGWLAGLSGWLEGLAQFGGVLGAMVIAWLLFPSVAARYRVATGWNPADTPALATDLHSFLVTLPRDASPHGARFHYVSPNSDMLGWILERAGGQPYARLLSELIWSRFGAEAGAYVTVDRAGAARSAGGICVTLRDLARFGEMVRNLGRVGDRQIVPRWWIEDILLNADRRAWLAEPSAAKFLPAGRYRSQWYMIGNAGGAYVEEL